MLPLCFRHAPDAAAASWRSKIPRSVWLSEVRGLTAWLASATGLDELSFLLGENASFLGREISMPGGRCDLVMRLAGPATLNYRTVAVEALLEEADADHAARLVYYAAELGADAAVLVAAKIPFMAAKILTQQNCAGPASSPAFFGAEISCWRSKRGATTAAALECRVEPEQHQPVLPDGGDSTGKELLAVYFDEIRSRYLEHSPIKRPEPRIGALCAHLRCPTAVRGVAVETDADGRFAYVISAPDRMTRTGLLMQMRGEREHLQKELDGLLKLNWPEASDGDGRDGAAVACHGSGVIRIAGRFDCRDAGSAARLLLRLQENFHVRAHRFRDDPLALLL